MAGCAPASTCRGEPTAVDELELLLELDGARFEMAPGVIVEFSARRVDQTPQRPHGVAYAFVMRPKAGGAPWVRFDNSHRVRRGGAATGKDKLPMIIGIEHHMIEVALITLAPLCSCWTIFGVR